MNEERNSELMAMAFGMATFQAQSLEYSLVSLYAATAIKNNDIDNKNTLQTMMDTRYKHTLGKLIKDALQKLEIPEDLQSELENALKKRNWVTHHFFREYGCIGFNEELKNKATKELNEIWPFLETVSDKIHNLVIKRLKESDRSKTEINTAIQQAINKYLHEQTRHITNSSNKTPTIYPL